MKNKTIALSGFCLMGGIFTIEILRETMTPQKYPALLWLGISLMLFMYAVWGEE